MAARTTKRPVQRYLFRGEPQVYKETVAAVYRLEGNDLDEDDRCQITGITEKITSWIAEPASNFDCTRGEADGLVQHLGLPTEYIDFSAKPEVAAAFAVKNSSPGQHAGIWLVDARRTMECSSAEIVEFKWKYSDRVRRQSAFGYGPISFRDLRSSEAAHSAGALWFEVTVSKADIERYGSEYKQLIDEKSDPGAGLLRWRVNCYVSETGKLRPRVASWISNRIPMVPLVARLRGRNSDFCDVVFQPPRSIPAWNKAREQEASLHYWSADFSDRLPKDCLSPCPVGTCDLGYFPGTYHRVARP